MKTNRLNLNQSGQASPEFLFSMIVSIGLFLLFLSISLTFTVVEVGQYIAFSVARAQVGANLTPAAQLAAANAKYQQLQGVSELGVLFKSGWFVFGNPDIRQGCGTGATPTFRSTLGDGTSSTCSPGGAGQLQFEQVYMGASIPFQSKILGMQVPFFNPPSGDSTGFQSHINAILIREPAQSECQAYWTKRGSALTGLHSGQAFYVPGSYVPMEDTGC